MSTIELKNVTKTFGKHTAVSNLSLLVPQGSVYGFIGPNGSGKTTTLRMIMNILFPDSGEIRIFGETLKSSIGSRIFRIAILMQGTPPRLSNIVRWAIRG